MATGVSKTQWKKNKGVPQSTPQPSDLVHLTYTGKRPEEEILQTAPVLLKQMWPAYAPAEAPNRLYYGDNLPILAELLHDPQVHGQVRLIYIDPPYATSSVFQSRNQSDAYTDLLAGADYLEFMRERLIIMRELLAEDGSLYVHLDDNMAFYIKVLLDEIFGRGNFRSWITRKKCNPKNYTRKTYGNVADYLLFYTKSDSYVWHRPVEGWTPERIAKEYQYSEVKTGRRYKKVPVHAPGVRNGATGRLWRGMSPPPGKHWQYTPDKLDAMDARGEIYWSPTGNPRRKVYLDESDGIPVQDIWLDFRDAHNQNIAVTGYPTEKNPAMLARLIGASSDPGDLVLDCFCGSGTTLSVASQLGRHWLGIDNGSEAIATTLRRFANGTQPMGDFVSTRNGKVQATPSLFDLTDIPMETKTSPANHTPITDFALYSDKSVIRDLSPCLTEWQNLIQPPAQSVVKERPSKYASASKTKSTRKSKGGK